MKKTVFERYEEKYILTNSQKESLMEALSGHIIPDVYRGCTISNIYYDTDSFELIRTSLERPVYKEKLRLRSYGTPSGADIVFLELKKKYKGIVYKRRLTIPYNRVPQLFKADISVDNAQIYSEIKHFVSLYTVSEKAFISYDRVAYRGVEDQNLRITFDSKILFRKTALQLDKGVWGSELLDPNQVIMEIKIFGVFPLFLGSILSELGIFPTTFSKYGSCYKKFIADSITREMRCASC
jgi:SPX domain-containing protein involved in vacuolar polyphosphate accumulation